MKIRTGFVSNSSSSSYVVNADLTSFGIRCLAIDPSRLRSVQRWLNAFKLSSEPEVVLDPNTQWYVTRYITEYEPDGVYDALDKHTKFDYMTGQLDGTPYEDGEDDPEIYRSPGGDDYRDAVYIRKEHTVMAVMKPAEVAEFVRKTYPESAQVEAYVIDDHIIIKPLTKESTDDEAILQ